MNNKIKALLQLKGENICNYAKYTNRSQASVSNKISRASWNVADFIKLAEMTNTELAFIDKETSRPLIVFDEADLRTGK